MEEISNKTLATLLVVAIVISLAGTFFAMRGTSVISKTITGYQAADSGEARVNITQTASITLNQDVVSFGEGFRNSSDTCSSNPFTCLCNITSSIDKPNCWENASEYDPQDFVLENNGNVYVNVTINSSNATNFLDDARTVGAPVQTYQYQAANTTGDGGCEGMQTSWVEFAETELQPLCDRFLTADDGDSINVSIKLGIPDGVFDNSTATVTFSGSIVS